MPPSASSPTCVEEPVGSEKEPRIHACRDCIAEGVRAAEDAARKDEQGKPHKCDSCGGRAVPKYDVHLCAECAG